MDQLTTQFAQQRCRCDASGAVDTIEHDLVALGRDAEHIDPIEHALDVQRVRFGVLLLWHESLDAHVAKVREYARAHHACETTVVSAQLESDLVDLTPEEAAEYLKELGASESGVNALIRGTYQLLGLRTFFTFNEKETRAWTVQAGDTAPRAAGKIHTDFERGFIKAETVHWKHLVDGGSVAFAREKGHYRVEGKEYVVQDGDVMLFRFNV